MITGKFIKTLRENKGISQEKLAKLVGISQAHIAKIENEKVNPTLSTINKMLSVLQVRKEIKCSKLMQRKIISISPTDNVNNAIKLMKIFKISQIPVIEHSLNIGSITERTILQHLDKNLSKIKIREIMEQPFPVLSWQSNTESVKSLLEFHQAILLSEKGKIVGIITKSDLLNIADIE